MASDKSKRAALVAAGWTEEREGADRWAAPAGTARPTAWSTHRAFWYLARGNASRVLASLGWDVAREYIGGVGVVSIGDHVLHPTKAPRLITIRAALKREGLPPPGYFEQEAIERAVPTV